MVFVFHNPGDKEGEGKKGVTMPYSKYLGEEFVKDLC